jgi:hypothetical protein
MIISFYVIVLFSPVLVAQDITPKQETKVECPLSLRELVDSLFPVGPLNGSFPDKARATLTVRHEDPYLSSVFWFQLTDFYDGSQQSDVAFTPQENLSDQFETFCNMNAKTVEDFVRLFKITRYTKTERQCPKLAELLSDFRSLNQNLLLPDEIIMDSDKYLILSESRMRYLKLSFIDSNRSIVGSNDSLTHWIHKAEKILIDCQPK